MYMTMHANTHTHTQTHTYLFTLADACKPKRGEHFDTYVQ